MIHQATDINLLISSPKAGTKANQKKKLKTTKNSQAVKVKFELAWAQNYPLKTMF